MADKKVEDSPKSCDDVPIYENLEEKTGLQRDSEYCLLSTAMINEESLYTAVHRDEEGEIQVENITRNSCTTEMAEDTAIPGKEKPQKDKHSATNKILSITIVASVVAIILLICIAVLFAEFAKLKQTATPQQVTLEKEASSISLLQLQQMKEEIKNEIQNYTLNIVESQTLLIEKLNASIFEELHTKLQQVSAMLDENTDQLNRMFEMRLMELSQNISLLQNKTDSTTNIISASGQFETLPATSCTALPPSSPSSHYWVRASNGSAVRVYCDMTLSCGNTTGGWVRVAELDSNEECPDGFTEETDTTTNIQTCRINDTGITSCSSPVNFSDTRLEYSKVCGKIIAFQKGSPDAFYSRKTIDQDYLEGVSLTVGNQHIWSFVASTDETSFGLTSKCPCIVNGSGSSLPPAFVGDDYFCDTGSHDGYNGQRFYGDDPLWDGAGCGPMNTCCSFNNPPWFYRQLPQPTTDAIEMRVCRNQDRSDEDIQIQTIDIFVQ